MASILVVDVSCFKRMTLDYLIQKGGHSVIGMTGDGKVAVKLCKELEPDLVVLDIVAKGMDRLAALETIVKKNSKTKVLMITAGGSEENRDEVCRLGASGHLQRPFTAEEITDMIEMILVEA